MERFCDSPKSRERVPPWSRILWLAIVWPMLGFLAFGWVPPNGTTSNTLTSTTTQQAFPKRTQQRVLALYGIGNEMPAIQKVEKVLKRTLRQSNPERIDYYSETLDVSRFPELP